ncbi:MAG: hypothetical protein KVP17_001300 [Porospora cf. gigantea B]|uniref:uncharacterized protein n=2 Tax=Porospora cf. gigantea B TaxID=2853592 RepID=UPI003571F1FE|nr:MAG: hypothetical protein KVP17_001300 [Porospora cf. gigantea B]
MRSLGFIGGGKMCQALAKGFVAAGLYKASDILVSDPITGAELTAFGFDHTTDNGAVLDRDVVFLAVKPQYVHEALRSLVVSKPLLIVSIVMGLSVAEIRSLFGNNDLVRVVRTMPNTPALVNCSASAFAASENASPEDVAFVKTLLQSVGIAHSIPERLIDAATGVSGSGPAWVYTVIEAMADAGVIHGLPRDISVQLAAQTVKGAAEMVLSTGRHTAQLRDDVCSPGGSTIAGVQAYEEKGLRSAVMAACSASTLKAKSMSP